MCIHLLEPIDYVVVAYFLRNWARLESAALRCFIAKLAQATPLKVNVVRALLVATLQTLVCEWYKHGWPATVSDGFSIGHS
jgi:hypothetical protein